MCRCGCYCGRIRRPPRGTSTETLFPDTTVVRAMPASEPGRDHIRVPVLELRDISKGYAEGRGVRTEVLKSINLSVGSGEFVAILGFSGTGKTTLISLLAGQIGRAPCRERGCQDV